MNCVSAAFALLIFGLSGMAAAEPRAPRFHLLTPALHGRLAQRHRRLAANIEAVAHYRRASGLVGGSAFLISGPDENGIALALTNHHVALYDKSTVRGDRLLFHPAGAQRGIAAKIVECLATDAALDYALLAVQLPKALRKLAPTRLSTSGDYRVQRVYNASFPQIWSGERQRRKRGQPSRVALTGSNRAAFARGLRARKHIPKTIQTGRVNTELWIDPLITLRIAVESGSSGSPVFAKRNDRAIAMLSAGGATDLAFAIPLALVLDDIAAQTKQLGDPKAVEMVQRLLDGLP
ncbi:MAG: trypsin-like peptidase domain-containing protein [Deltaproteobacteria bacterium]|nr:trypsin-like peptidase domain-containing protein [Deltaproteobacteria bacterium]